MNRPSANQSVTPGRTGPGKRRLMAGLAALLLIVLAVAGYCLHSSYKDHHWSRHNYYPVIGPDGNVYCIRNGTEIACKTLDNKLIWAADLGQDIYSFDVSPTGYVYAIDGANRFCALDDTGRLNWTKPLYERILVPDRDGTSEESLANIYFSGQPVVIGDRQILLIVDSASWGYSHAYLDGIYDPLGNCIALLREDSNPDGIPLKHPFYGIRYRLCDYLEGPFFKLNSPSRWIKTDNTFLVNTVDGVLEVTHSGEVLHDPCTITDAKSSSADGQSYSAGPDFCSMAAYPPQGYLVLKAYHFVEDEWLEPGCCYSTLACFSSNHDELWSMELEEDITWLATDGDSLIVASGLQAIIGIENNEVQWTHYSLDNPEERLGHSFPMLLEPVVDGSGNTYVVRQDRRGIGSPRDICHTLFSSAFLFSYEALVIDRKGNVVSNHALPALYGHQTFFYDDKHNLYAIDLNGDIKSFPHQQ